MFNWNPFAISGLLLACTSLPLFLIIAIRGKSKLATVYSLHILSLFIWGTSVFLVASTSNKELAEHYLKFGLIGVIFIPTFFYHTIHTIVGQKKKFFLFFIYIQSFFFLILNFYKNTLGTPHFAFNSFYYYKANSVFTIFFILWMIIVCSAYWELIKHRKNFPSIKPNTLNLLYLTLIGFFGGLNNFLPIFNVHIYPHGNFLISVYVMLASYFIFQHQLLDLKIFIEKSLVYSVLLTALTIIYLISVISIERFLQTIYQYESPIVSIFIAFFIGIVFIPLRNWVQKFMDYTLFRGTQSELAQQNILLREELTKAEKFKTINTLSSGIAHEIKNPLTAIKTFSEYLPSRLDDKEFLKKFSRIVGKEVDRIDSMVHQLIDYSKPESPTLKPTHIHDLIDSTLDILNSKFIDQKIKIHKIYAHPSTNQIQLDSNQIRQALLNIFLNAIESMPNGGALSIKTILHDSRFKQYFEICVEDTGLGISKEDLKHIFDPFFTQKDNGTGLGLAITQNIIESHKGKILVTSRKGHGATFIIRLPTN